MKQIFKKYNIEITNEQVDKFNKYFELLIYWNKKINLTSITDYDEVVKKHFLDSVLLLSTYDNNLFVDKNIIDLGTGAGFPGIPLAILLSQSHFVLVDSLNKRIDFLKIVISDLKLNNVELIHSRAEDLGQNANYREQFDFCVSRAVAELPLLLEYCSPFINVDGYLLLYKSKKISSEIEISNNALNELKCSVNNLIKLSDDIDYERYILEIRKVGSTPDKYPRKAGKPKKKPL